MLRKMLHAKIPRATVTHCDVDYVGSITIDADLLRATGMLPSESVLVADCDNGNRFETYVFEGEAGSGVIGINGAAARLVKPGHKIIICAFAQVDQAELDDHEARVVVVDDHNRMAQQLTYRAQLSDSPTITV